MYFCRCKHEYRTSMKHLQKQLLLEQIIYAAIWVLIWGTPLVGFLLDDDRPSDGRGLWEEVSATWLLVLPFFLLFLVHNYVLIPRLLLRKYYIRYVVSLIFTVGILFVYLPGYLQALGPHPGFRGHREIREAEHNILYPDGAPAVPPAGAERNLPHSPMGPPFLLIHIIVAILLVGFNLTIRFFLKSLHDDEMLKELEHGRLESELQYLKYQLNPHFFMNTLNNIHALVDIDAEKAKQTIIELSKLMRYMLYEADKNQISLEREIQFLRNYIALMKLRYTDRLDIRTDFPLVVPDVQVPPLLFISLLENAFKHGVSYREDSFIDVRMVQTDDGILFGCRNSRHTCTRDAHHGIGIDNIRKRLRLLYGTNYTFAVTEHEDCYEVLLIIPPL